MSESISAVGSQLNCSVYLHCNSGVCHLIQQKELDFDEKGIMEKSSHFGEKIFFSNACADQTKLGINKLLNKNCGKE